MAATAALRFMLSPSKIIPQRVVRGMYTESCLEFPHKCPDIREINFKQLRDQGYNAIVFDKDNCLVGHSPTIRLY